MTKRVSGVRVLPGSSDILVVAPHGPFIDGEYQNDIRTGIIVEEIHRRLGCAAIINDLFFKPKGEVKKSFADYHLDLFRVDHASKVGEYTEGIRSIIEAPGKTFVLWVHGITDDKAEEQEQENRSLGIFTAPESLNAVIGYGQGGDPKCGEKEDRLSARRENVENFRDRLTVGGMTTLLTHPESWNYRGRDQKRYNQWFVGSGYGHDRVESIQLEIMETGFRDSEENARKTAAIISEALQALRT